MEFAIKFLPSRDCPKQCAQHSGRYRDGRLTLGADVSVRTTGGDGYVGGLYNGRYATPPEPAPLTNRGTLAAENGFDLSLFTADFE